MRYLIKILKEVIENDPEIWKKQRNIKNIKRVEIKDEAMEQKRESNTKYNHENFPSKYLPERELNFNQIYCRLNHSEEDCWLKYPSKRPSNRYYQRGYQYVQRPSYPSRTGFEEYSYGNAYLNSEKPSNRQYYPTANYRERENYNPRGMVTNDKTTNLNNLQHNISPYNYRSNRKGF